MIQLIGRTYRKDANRSVTVTAYLSDESGNVSWKSYTRIDGRLVVCSNHADRSETMAFVRGFLNAGKEA